MMRIKAYSAQQKGMTMLEVLVSVVVLALGLLGIAGLLMLSSKANNSSYAKLRAVQSVYDIFDRMRANAAAATAGNYNISNITTSGTPGSVATPGVMCNTSPCTPAQLATYDTWYWLTKDVSKLPSGSGSVRTASSGASGNTVITVTVQWDDSPAQAQLGAISTTAANPNLVQLSIQSQL